MLVIRGEFAGRYVFTAYPFYIPARLQLILYALYCGKLIAPTNL